MPEERNYSEEAARAIDEEALRIVEEALERAHAILVARRRELDAIAAELVERESLTREELDRLVAAPAETGVAEASHAA